MIASVCILGGIALFMYAVLKKESGPSKEEQTAHRYHKIINNAHNEARAILDTTSIASTEILAGSKATSEHIEENLDKVLQSIAATHIEYLKKTSDEFAKSYDEKLGKLQEELSNHTQKAVLDSEKRLNESIEKYLKPVADSAANSHAAMEERTQQLMDQVQQEIAAYKKARFEKIEAEVDDLVKKTYKDVFHKALNEATQQQLIMESLEKAKNEGGITV